MRSRLRRLPFAVGVGALGAWLAPFGPLLSGVGFGLAVLVLPELQPRLRRAAPTGELAGALREPQGRWRPGTVVLDGPGVRWRPTLADPARTFGADTRFSGHLGEEHVPVVGGRLAVLGLLTPEGPVVLAVPPERADEVAGRFRLGS